MKYWLILNDLIIADLLFRAYNKGKEVIVMDAKKTGRVITEKRKALGLTQQEIADQLHISFQAVSKWETGAAYPDVALLTPLAAILKTSVDTLLGYVSPAGTSYEARYRQEGYYWGLEPNHLCYEIMRLKPPVNPFRVLELGCGEGKDAVFLAKNGYQVTAFDLAESGLEKARSLAEKSGVHVNFFKADLRDYRPDGEFDIIYSSGVLYYAETPEIKRGLMDSLKTHTKTGGLNVLNVFVKKPFIKVPPHREKSESTGRGWLSGELFTYYHDWLFHRMEEKIFDCNSSGIPHQHCMDVMIAEKKAGGTP